MRLLAYIGRFFHGVVKQRGVETVLSYISNGRVYSRTDKGVNAVANPVDFDGDFVSDFVIVWGEALGRPRRKEYRYFLPHEVLRLFEAFLPLIPKEIDARALISKPRKKKQEVEIGIGKDFISFSSSGFEQYAIRRILGYFYRRYRGVMNEREILDAMRGFVRRYPPLAPPEPLVLWRTDVEVDDGNRYRIERRIRSRALFWARKKRYLRRSKRLINRKPGPRFYF